jgi:integrase
MRVAPNVYSYETSDGFHYGYKITLRPDKPPYLKKGFTTQADASEALDSLINQYNVIHSMLPDNMLDAWLRNKIRDEIPRRSPGEGGVYQDPRTKRWFYSFTHYELDGSRKRILRRRDPVTNSQFHSREDAQRALEDDLKSEIQPDTGSMQSVNGLILCTKPPLDDIVGMAASASVRRAFHSVKEVQKLFSAAPESFEHIYMLCNISNERFVDPIYIGNSVNMKERYKQWSRKKKFSHMLWLGTVPADQASNYQAWWISSLKLAGFKLENGDGGPWHMGTATSTKKPRSKLPTQPVRTWKAWDGEQANRFFSWLPEDDDDQLIWRIIIATGASPSDVCSITWKCVQNGEVPLSKGKVPRLINLNQELQDDLNAYREKLYKMHPSLADDSSLIFADVNGKPLSRAIGRRFFRSQDRCRNELSLTENELPCITLTGLRYTFIANLIRANTLVLRIEELTGLPRRQIAELQANFQSSVLMRPVNRVAPLLTILYRRSSRRMNTRFVTGNLTPSRQHQPV